MADMPFNIALGRAVEFYNRVESNDPTDAVLTIVLFKVSEADDTLADYATLGDIISGSNTEADFTNYARIELSAVELAALPAPDDGNNRIDIDIPDQTWTTAGGATNNTLTKLVICYDSDSTGGTDANIIPISHHDFVLTTDASDITAQINAAGFYRAAR